MNPQNDFRERQKSPLNPDYWSCLDLTTQNLGDFGTRRRRKIGEETVDLQFQLSSGITRDGLINDQINTSGIPDVLGADKRISSNLLEVHANGTTSALSTVVVTHSELRIPISRREDAGIGKKPRTGHGDCYRIDGNGLRIGESHGTEPVQ